MAGMFRRLIARPDRAKLTGLTSTGLALILLAVAPLPLPHLRPAHAQSVPEAENREAETEKGFSLMEEGAKLLFHGLMREMAPSIAELEGAFSKIAPEIEAQLNALGPQLSELVRMMQDVRNYEMPVMLENGDILIRRKDPLPPVEAPAPRSGPPQPGPNGETEL